MLSDRLGRRPVLLGSQLGTAATLVVLGVTTSQAGVVLLVALLGLTSNSARPAFSAMTTDIVAPEDRVRAFSLNYWAINLGFAIAPALGGLLAKAGYLTLFLADAATTLVFAVLVFLKVPESRPEVVVVEGERPGSLADVFRDRRLPRRRRPDVPVRAGVHAAPVRAAGADGRRRPQRVAVRHGDRPQRAAHRASSRCR